MIGFFFFFWKVSICWVLLSGKKKKNWVSFVSRHFNPCLYGFQPPIQDEKVKSTLLCQMASM